MAAGKQDLKILPGTSIYVGGTTQEADDYYQSLQGMIPPDLGIEYLSKTLEMDSVGLSEGQFRNSSERKSAASQRGSCASIAILTIKQAYEHVVGSMGGLIIKGSVGDVCDQMEDLMPRGMRRL